MSQQVITKLEAKTISWNNNAVSVYLPDLEQVIIEAPAKSEYIRINDKWEQQFSDPRKFRVIKFEYRVEDGSDELSLVTVVGNFFLKNSKKIGTKDSYLHHEALTKELLEQIPDELHRYAREYMRDTFIPTFSKVIANGVIVKPYNKPQQKIEGRQ